MRVGRVRMKSHNLAIALRLSKLEAENRRLRQALVRERERTREAEIGYYRIDPRVVKPLKAERFAWLRRCWR